MTGSPRLWALLAERIRERPGGRALIHGAHAWGFRELHEAAEGVRGGLRKADVGPGVMIGVALPNGPGLVAATLGILGLPAAVVLIPPRFQALELEAIARHVGLAACLTAPGSATGIASALGARGAVSISPAPGLELTLVRSAGPDTESRRQAENVALVKFSSGSTGVPKGIALTEANLLAEGDHIVGALGFDEGGRVLAPVSLSHSYGFDLGVLPMILAGTTLEVHDSFVPRHVIRDLTRESGAVLLGVPAMYRVLLRQRTSVSLEGTRLLSCTAPLPPDVASAVAERYGSHPCQHYGSSEAGAVALMDSYAAPRNLISVGRAISGVDVRIAAPDGSALAPGQQGEIVIRSPAVASGYLMGQGSRADTLVEGVFRSGDVGSLDLDGYLTVYGRLDQLINVGGMKVSPTEVVEVLECAPGVREAVAAGLEDDVGEHVVVAMVAADGPVTEARLLDLCRERLADYKVPRRIVIRDKLPRGPSGEVRLRPEDLRP